MTDPIDPDALVAAQNVIARARLDDTLAEIRASQERTARLEAENAEARARAASTMPQDAPASPASTSASPEPPEAATAPPGLSGTEAWRYPTDVPGAEGDRRAHRERGPAVVAIFEAPLGPDVASQRVVDDFLRSYPEPKKA